MEEKYIGAPFQPEQKVIHLYDDYEVIGTWGCVVMNEDNTTSIIPDVGGNMLSRTVKFKGEDGQIHLDKEWITDKSINAR